MTPLKVHRLDQIKVFGVVANISRVVTLRRPG